MPYIKPESRPRYAEHVTEVTNAIVLGSETKLIKGEYIGFYVNRIVRNYLGTLDQNLPYFNSFLFNEAKRKVLATHADRIASQLTGGDPMDAAGDMNYCISAVFWGLLGDAAGVDQANYGLRAYLRGALESVRDAVKDAKFENTEQKVRVMQFRRYMTVLGVLGDVIDEAYRRKTVPYEDKKIAENGDIWSDGKLVT